MVYKVDRLTRSLTDFAKMVEIFDGHGVDVPVLRLLVDNTHTSGNTLLAASDIGVFRSTDAVPPGRPFNLGAIPAVPAFDIEQNNNGVIFVGTHGQGAYQLVAAVPTPTVSPDWFSNSDAYSNRQRNPHPDDCGTGNAETHGRVACPPDVPCSKPGRVRRGRRWRDAGGDPDSDRDTYADSHTQTFLHAGQRPGTIRDDYRRLQDSKADNQ